MVDLQHSRPKQIILCVIVCSVLTLLFIGSGIHLSNLIEQNEEEIEQERFSACEKIIEAAKIEQENIEKIINYCMIFGIENTKFHISLR